MINKFKYDTWKLESKYETYRCEHCEQPDPQEENQEVEYYDADRNKASLWLCNKCTENQVWI